MSDKTDFDYWVGPTGDDATREYWRERIATLSSAIKVARTQEDEGKPARAPLNLQTLLELEHFILLATNGHLPQSWYSEDSGMKARGPGWTPEPKHWAIHYVILAEHGWIADLARTKTMADLFGCTKQNIQKWVNDWRKEHPGNVVPLPFVPLDPSFKESLESAAKRYRESRAKNKSQE